MPFNVTKLLEDSIKQGASDLHLSVGMNPVVRINRILTPLSSYTELTAEDVQYFLSQILTQEQKDILDINKEVDFSIALGNLARFRVNAFYQKGYPAVALRVIPAVIPTLEDLHLPPIVGTFCNLTQGLVLVVGPTGSGKSTTIAAIIDRINSTRAEHIVTIEDPIEYIFTNKSSVIQQREMFLDTHSWDGALKSVLRQDPNIVFVGEMRDMETINAALNIAETGHLVLATLHTNSASDTLDRIISAFPPEKQHQVQFQLAQILEVVISQRLLTSAQYGVVPALEILLPNDAVKNLIREGKFFQIDNVIGTSLNLGMQTLEHSLVDLINEGVVEVSEALRVSSNTENLRRLIKLNKISK